MANEYTRLAEVYDTSTGCSLVIEAVHLEAGGIAYRLQAFTTPGEETFDGFLDEVQTKKVA